MADQTTETVNQQKQETKPKQKNPLTVENGKRLNEHNHHRKRNQSSDILQHSQNRPTGDRWLKLENTTIRIIK